MMKGSATGGVIDIHSHILPNVDDGAHDLTDAVLMAELAAEGGTRVLIATPHDRYLEMDRAGRDPYDTIVAERLQTLRSEIDQRRIPIRICAGMEIYCTDDIAERIRNHTVRPMPDGEHYLLEFGFFEKAAHCNAMLESVLSLGVRVIIAHPERYRAVQKDRKLAALWKEMGCKLQINRENVMGYADKKAHKAAWEMIREDLVTFVASDAHDPYVRTPYLDDVRQKLSEECSPAYAARLLRENAEQLWVAQDL